MQGGHRVSLPLVGWQHSPQECSRGMAIKAWCWGGKSVGNGAVVSFIADCSACLFRDVWLPPALVPLKLATSLIVPARCSIHHFATSPVSSPLRRFWIRAWCSPLLDVLGSAGGWWGLCCGNLEPVPMACHPPPWLHDGCALRGGSVSGAGQDIL